MHRIMVFGGGKKIIEKLTLGRPYRCMKDGDDRGVILKEQGVKSISKFWPSPFDSTALLRQ